MQGFQIFGVIGCCENLVPNLIAFLESMGGGSRYDHKPASILKKPQNCYQE